MKKSLILLYSILITIIIMYGVVIIFTKEHNPLIWRSSLQLSFLVGIIGGIIISGIELYMK